MYDIRYSPEARDDVRGIRAYITNELKSPIAAANTIKKIRGHMDILKRHPDAGEKIALITDIETDYRKLNCGNYLAFYRLEGKVVFVIRIFRGNQDWLQHLFGISSVELAESGVDGRIVDV